MRFRSWMQIIPVLLCAGTLPSCLPSLSQSTHGTPIAARTFTPVVPPAPNMQVPADGIPSYQGSTAILTSGDPQVADRGLPPPVKDVAAMRPPETLSAAITQVSANTIDSADSGQISTQRKNGEIVPRPLTQEEMRLRQAAKPLEPSREQLISVANEAARPVDPPLVALLRNFFENRPAEVESLLKRYDRKSQELIMSMLPLWDIVNKGGIEKASPKEVTMVVAETERISAALAPHAKLEIDKLCFCSVVQDFAHCAPRLTRPRRVRERQAFARAASGPDGVRLLSITAAARTLR